MAGGIDWFRWHHGSVTDPKFGLIAKKAGARLGDVLAVWAFVLESASANEPRGTVGQIDAEALEFLLDLDEGRVFKILDAMSQRGLLGAGGVVVSWEKRQPKREREDGGSTERVRAFRERQRQTEQGNAMERQETPRGEERRVEKKNTPSLRSGVARATRKAPEDFAVTADMQTWAATDCPGVDVDRETAKFRDHTFKTAHSDWPAAWRNWIRRAADSLPRRSAPVGRSFAEQSQAVAAQRVASFAPGVAARTAQLNTIDMEASSVFALARD